MAHSRELGGLRLWGSLKPCEGDRPNSEGMDWAAGGRIQQRRPHRVDHTRPCQQRFLVSGPRPPLPPRPQDSSIHLRGLDRLTCRELPFLVDRSGRTRILSYFQLDTWPVYVVELNWDPARIFSVNPWASRGLHGFQDPSLFPGTGKTILGTHRDSEARRNWSQVPAGHRRGPSRPPS